MGGEVFSFFHVILLFFEVFVLEHVDYIRKSSETVDTRVAKTTYL